MKLKLTRLALGLLAAGTCLSAAAQQQGVTDTEIVLGDILPLTGPPALLGVAHNLGVKAAIAEVNAAGGIHGRKLRLISEDDGYVPSRTIQGVRKLINSDKVFALTSVSGTAQAQAAMPLIQQAGLPAMAPSPPTKACTSRPSRTCSRSATTCPTRWKNWPPAWPTVTPARSGP